MAHTPWTDERVALARDLRAAGMPWREVAARLGVSVPCLTGAMDRRGFGRRHAYRPKAETLAACEDALDVLGVATSDRVAEVVGASVAVTQIALRALKAAGKAELVGSPGRGQGRHRRWRLTGENDGE